MYCMDFIDCSTELLVSMYYQCCFTYSLIPAYCMHSCNLPPIVVHTVVHASICTQHNSLVRMWLWLFHMSFTSFCWSTALVLCGSHACFYFSCNKVRCYTPTGQTARLSLSLLHNLSSAGGEPMSCSKISLLWQPVVPPTRSASVQGAACWPFRPFLHRI